MVRTIFVLRAVAGLSAAETAELLAEYGGPKAAGWNAEAVRGLFSAGTVLAGFAADSGDRPLVRLAFSSQLSACTFPPMR